MDEKQTIFTNWVNLYTDYLFKWAFHKTSNREIAEDLVQETFLIAFNGYDKFEGKSSPKTWLTAILNNLIYEYFRKKAKLKGKIDLDFNDFFSETGHWTLGEIPSEDWDNFNLFDDDNFLTIFENCLELLPQKWNAVIKLKYLKEINPNDICKELEISQTNYWQMIHRAKLNLRKCLESKYNK